MNNPSAIPMNLESPAINLTSIFSHEFRNEIAKAFKPAFNGVAELVNQFKQDIYPSNTNIDIALETFNKLAHEIRQLPNTASFINDIDKSVVEVIMDMNALMLDYLESHKTVALTDVICDINTNIYLPKTVTSAMAQEFGWPDITQIAITDTFTYDMLVDQVKKWLDTHKDEYVII